MGLSLVLTFHWLKLCHMTIPIHKGDWEMWSRHMARQKQRILDLAELLGIFKGIEKVGLLIHIMALSCSIQGRKCRISKRQESHSFPRLNI